MKQPDLGIQNIADPQKNRHIHAAFLHPLDDLHQADGRGPRIPERRNGDFTVVIECEISRTPVVDPVQICGIPDGPPFQCFSANVHLVSVHLHFFG